MTLGLASIFLLLLVLSFVSAAITLHPSSTELNITHGSSKNFNFKIENEHEDTSTHSVVNVSVDPTDLTGKETILSGNISISSIPNKIEGKTNSSNIKVKISIPKNTLPGDYSGTLTISGDHNGTSGSPNSKYLDIKITVPESRELSVSSPEFDVIRENKKNITIKNQGNLDLTSINLNSSKNWINFSENDFSLIPGESKEVTVMFTSDVSDLKYGDNDITITANSSTGTHNTGTLNLFRDFTEEQRNDDLEIEDFEFKYVEGYGDAKDAEFYPLDKVRTEFTLALKDKDDYEIEDIEIEVSIFDELGDEIATLDEMEINENDFDLDEDGDEIDLELIFKLSEDFLEENEFEGDYTLWIKAEGTLEEGDREEFVGNKTGISASLDFEIKEGSVYIENLEIDESISCNSEIQYNAKIWNLMEDDIERDEEKNEGIFIEVYNKDLNISKIVEFKEDLDSLESSSFDVLIEIPKGIEEGEYDIVFTPYEEYEKSFLDDIYQDMGDYHPAYTSTINVSGLWCKTVYNDQTKIEMIKADLESGEKSGDEFIINITITNPEDKKVTYDLSNITVDWAESISLGSSELTLESEESVIVQLIIESKKDVYGDQVIEWTISKNKIPVASYELPVTVRESKGILDWFEGWNWKIIMNIILGIAIVGVVTGIIVSSHKQGKKKKKLKKEDNNIKKAIKK